MSKVVAVYAGSFDPITKGHVDVIERAAKLFDSLIIGVGISADKKTLFSADERVVMLREEVKHLLNVSVQIHDGLTVDLAKAHKATVLVRGLRSAADYTYEMTMSEMNNRLAPAVESVFLPTKPAYSHVSSSLAKEIAKYKGDLSSLVSSFVAKKLMEKLAIGHN